jgi:N6-L-threonylcarbamoyladenine synthase
MQNTNIYILAIESSCDDTSCAIFCNELVLANITANQAIHTQYGGVVPELASRDHQKNIIPVIDAALKQANIEKHQLNAIAVTRGPGLLGSLLVGISVAKSMALALGIPIIEVNHMQAHILAHFIQEKEVTKSYPNFPFLCLTVSGGHTQLVKVNDYLNFEVLGETIDDAVGEAFDKAAKLLGLPYPGGPLIDKHAALGDATRFTFSETKLNGLDYSFSGIKTSFLYFVQNNLQKNPNFITENLNDICASYQRHLIQILLKNTKRALEIHQLTQLAIAGGVSANSELRQQLKQLETELGITAFIPKMEYCTDNAAMIGITAYYKWLKAEVADMRLTPLTRYAI